MGHPAGVKRDFKALERRRLRALRLLDKGLRQSEVARRLGVAQQSVSRWAQQAAQGGPQALRHPGRAGRKPQLSAEQLTQLEQSLLDGPEAHGYPTPLWTCRRVTRLIQEQFGVAYHPGTRLEDPGAAGLESAATGRTGTRAQRGKHPPVAASHMARR